jgi:hypothetical protein
LIFVLEHALQIGPSEMASEVLSCENSSSNARTK